MKSKLISIRLNPNKLTSQKVETILSKLPSRCKSEYIRNAIVAYNDFEHLKELMKQAFLEAMDERKVIQTEKKNNENGDFNDYLKSL